MYYCFFSPCSEWQVRASDDLLPGEILGFGLLDRKRHSRSVGTTVLLASRGWAWLIENVQGCCSPKEGTLKGNLAGDGKEPDLVSRARAGSALVRSELILQHLPELTRFVLTRMGHRLKRHTEVDDVCQNIFIRAFRGLHAVSPEAESGDFRAFLFQHARWELADMGRKSASFEGESNIPGGSLSLVEETAEGKPGEVLEFEELEPLYRLIEKLPVKLGSVVMLRLDGLSHYEIGRDLGENEATIRKRYSRAVEALKQLLPKSAEHRSAESGLETVEEGEPQGSEEQDG